MKDAVVWDMIAPCGSWRAEVSKKHIVSIFRVQTQFPWFAARMHPTTDGEESLLQLYHILEDNILQQKIC